MPTIGYDETEYDSGEFGDAVYGGVLPMPDVDACRDYLAGAGVRDDKWSDEEISQAILAERAAQARVCRTPADDAAWPADLAEALKRRVARSLSVRALPLGYQATVTDNGTGAIRLGLDYEIRRLEAPLRRLTVG